MGGGREEQRGKGRSWGGDSEEREAMGGKERSGRWRERQGKKLEVEMRE